MHRKTTLAPSVTGPYKGLMRKITLLSLLAGLLFAAGTSLHAESAYLAQKKPSCACADQCAKKKECAVHKHKDCDCS